jgi:hypothetical protein
MYCNDRLSNTTNTHKHTKYDVIVPHLHQLGWHTIPSLILAVGIHEIIHQPPIDHLLDLDIACTKVKSLMESVS